MKNIMSIDLEDYFCDLPFSEWDKYESRVENTTYDILDMFEKYDIKATFFTLGYIAEKFPKLIKKLQKNGHEVASHSYSHIDLRKVSEKEVIEDLEKSINVIENITNEKILGFRAPFFSVSPNKSNVFNIIKKKFKYDSSVFPVKTNLYGIPNAPREIYHPSDDSFIKNDSKEEFVELPPLTSRFLFMNIPIGGGFYFRFFPYFFTKNAIKNFNKNQQPAIFYFHPKDLDPDMPKIKEYSWHYYFGKKNIKKKFENLLSDFEFTSIKKYLESQTD